MKKSSILCLCILLFFVSIFSSCGSERQSPKPSNKDVLNVCLGAKSYSLDPAYITNTADGSLALHLFEGLYIMGEEGVPVLAQADSCELDEDGLVYTFVLKDNLKWSNGESLKASDYIYSWNRAAMTEGNEGRVDFFDIIDRNENGLLALESPDEKTLIVKLKRNTPYFLQLLCLPQFCPIYEKMINYNPEHWSQFPETCISNGAYKLSDIVQDSHIALEKNEHYHKADEVKTKKINFIAMKHGSTYSSFLTGEILFADRIPSSRIKEAAKRNDYYNKPSYGTYFLVFNENIKPFDNKLVREALALAIDRSYITNEISGGTNRPAAALVPPGIMQDSSRQDFRSQHGEFFNPTNHEANIERAKNLLIEAGYFEGGKEFPNLKYQYNNSPEHALIAKAIQKMWSELGITLELEEIDWNILMENAERGNFQIIRSGWMCDWNEADSILGNFKTGSPFNIAGFSNSEYDEFLNAAAQEKVPEIRSHIYFEAEKILLSQWTICPLFYYSDTYMQSEYLTGVKINPLEYKSFINAEIVS